MKELTALCLVCVCVVFAESVGSHSVLQAMRNEGIVKDVIPEPPREFLEVVYKSGVKVDLGNELTPTEVKDKPTIKWAAEKHNYYVLVFTNPDIPSRANPKDGEILHWLVVNILGDNVSEGEEIVEFIGSGPPPGSGLHRYVFLVYEQPGKINFDKETRINNRTFAHRGHFSINAFALEYYLGTPVAGNFFNAKYDDYVPVLHQQVGLNVNNNN